MANTFIFGDDTDKESDTPEAAGEKEQKIIDYFNEKLKPLGLTVPKLFAGISILAAALGYAGSEVIKKGGVDVAIAEALAKNNAKTFTATPEMTANPLDTMQMDTGTPIPPIEATVAPTETAQPEQPTEIPEASTPVPTQAPTLEAVATLGPTAETDSVDAYTQDKVVKWYDMNPPTTANDPNKEGGEVKRGLFQTFADGFTRVVRAENGESTAWSSLIKIDGWNGEGPCTIGDVECYWPEDYKLTGQGKGTFRYTIKADNTEGGYDTAASFSTTDNPELALYFTGLNGKVRYSQDGGITWEEFDLSNKKPGFAFPRDATYIFEITLGEGAADGNFYMDIGPQDDTGDKPQPYKGAGVTGYYIHQDTRQIGQKILDDVTGTEAIPQVDFKA